jgi:hypothetical protein
MPKAKNLREAYNNFRGEPLSTDVEFRDFYVERPKEAPSPAEELKGPRAAQARTERERLEEKIRGR